MLTARVLGGKLHFEQFLFILLQGLDLDGSKLHDRLKVRVRAFYDLFLGWDIAETHRRMSRL